MNGYVLWLFLIPEFTAVLLSFELNQEKENGFQVLILMQN